MQSSINNRDAPLQSQAFEHPPPLEMSNIKLQFLTVMPSPYQRQLFAAMARAPGISVDVAYFTSGAHDREWQAPDLLGHEAVMAGRTLNWLGPSAHWNPDVVGRITAARADLVVISDYSAPTAQVAMRHLARKGLPFVFWGEVPGFSARGAIGRFLRRRLQSPLRGAAGIAGIGEVAVEAYRELFPEKPVFNIPYFCDLAPFRSAARAQAGATKDTVDILFSGQMIARKGVDLLITAFAQVAHAHPKLRLLLLGNGPERERFAAMVPEGLSSRVLFLGHREPAELPSVFAAAEIFCLPSRHDGWGVVVNEALGAGLPIVVSDAVGAGRDLVVHGRNGFVFPSGDVPAMALALDALAGDAALRQAMSDEASRMAGLWDLDEGVRRWREAAAQVLDGGRAA